MPPSRRTSIAVGVLYILGTVFGIASVNFTPPADAPDVLAAVGANPSGLAVGVVLIMAMGLCLAFIPPLMFPILKRVDEAAAVVCVVFRSCLEMVAYASAALLYLALAGLAGHAGAADAGTAAALAGTLRDLARNPLLVFFFSAYAFAFYALLFRSRLVPRWLSAFGLVAISLHLVTGVLLLFGLMDDFSPANIAMNIPIMIQEMVMAVWFVAKGFDGKALEKLGVERA